MKPRKSLPSPATSGAPRQRPTRRDACGCSGASATERLGISGADSSLTERGEPRRRLALRGRTPFTAPRLRETARCSWLGRVRRERRAAASSMSGCESGTVRGAIRCESATRRPTTGNRRSRAARTVRRMLSGTAITTATTTSSTGRTSTVPSARSSRSPPARDSKPMPMWRSTRTGRLGSLGTSPAPTGARIKAT